MKKLLIVLALFLAACGGGSQSGGSPPPANWERKVQDQVIAALQKAPTATTPKGVQVFGTADATAIDQGVETNWKDFECAGYHVNRAQHPVKVVILPSQPDSNGDPAYRVRIRSDNPYWNSEHDMMKGSPEEFHYVLAAGQMVFFGTPWGDVIAIPQHNAGQEAHLATVVQYEMQHIGYGWYDGPKYEETQYHGPGGGHPIIPACPGSNLVSRSIRIVCGGAEQ